MENLSVFRSEDKYRLSCREAFAVRDRLDRILEPDAHAKGKDYCVRSLYFDSLNHIDFATKLAGTEIRKKIRLRVYSPDDQTCKLENKQKNGDLQHKVSLLIGRDAAEGLIAGKYGVLTQYFADSPVAVDMYQTMVQGLYRPAVMIEYRRLAYEYPMYNTRLTLDYNIRYSESCFDLFARDIAYFPALDDEVVLEVKYNGKLMRFISEALKPCHLTQTATSKYCLGRKAYYDYLY
ncbi:MAG: polyphosphate polymerase domain-containing protein [Aristaeellaceae bacterium]